MSTKLFVLHNKRCGKSRAALAYLDEQQIPYELVNYLDGVLTKKDIATLLQKLDKQALDIIRQNESLFKEEYKGRELSDQAWLEILEKNPSLIERPIIYNETAAVIGRPLENLIEFIKKA